MKTYNIEITDTFGGEANYSWVKRFKVTANTVRGAVTKLAKLEGSGWRKDWSIDDTTAYLMRGACIICFVSEVYEDTPPIYNYTTI